MLNGIVGIHVDGALQGAHGEQRFTFFLQHFPHENVRAGGSSIQPDGALQKLLRFIELLNAGISIREFIECDRVGRVDGHFLLELRDSFGDFGLVENKVRRAAGEQGEVLDRGTRL